MSTQVQQVRSALRGRPTTGPDASRWARVGYWAGLSVVQLLVVEYVVSATWRGMYSYRENFVSELGVQFCGPTGTWPCSALYPAMNVSIALFGLALTVASLCWLVTGCLDARGGFLLIVAGIGGVVAGVVSQAAHYEIHSFGATVMFVVGALGMMVAGGHRTLPRTSRIAVTSLGGIGLVSALLYISGHEFGLGIGTMERVVVYSLLAATILLAVANRATASRMKIPAGALDE